jgi:hypothetical protein
MIDDTLIHPPGWSFQMELLCTLSVTPAPLSARDGANPQL